MMLARRLQGHPADEIAKEFNLATSTVYRVLGEVKRSALFERARDHIAGHLLPLALATYEHELLNMNVEVARDVLQGLGLVGRQIAVKVEHDVKEDFDAWRLKRSETLEAITVDAVTSTDSSSTAGPGDGLPAPEPDAPLRSTLGEARDRSPDGTPGLPDGRLQD
jgi:DNA-binding IclR family transcriptional regulator